MSTFTDSKIVAELIARLPLSVLKQSKNDLSSNSVTVAISTSGHMYWGGKVESDSNLLDITSEQSALLLAAQQGDFNVTKLISVTEAETASVSPIALKIMTDWSSRTELPLSYNLVSQKGESLFETNSVNETIPWYIPKKNILTLPKERLGNNFEKNMDITHENLKRFAIKGLSRGFHNYDGATAYGVSVGTKDNTIYFTSQYSSPDKRLGVHAEAAAIVSAFMHGEKDITHLGLISPKFKTNPCAPCGACRQFIGEFAKKNNWNITIISFASESDDILSFSIDDLIPHMWAS